MLAGSKVEYYAEIYRTRDDYKRDLKKMFENIRLVIDKKPASVIDYGCGRGNLADLCQEAWGCKIAKYDPAIPEFSQRPEGSFDLAVNTDVLEHIPEGEIDGVLSAIRGYTGKAFFNVHLSKAGEILSNGENAHCTVRPPEWWRAKIEKHFGQAYIVPSFYMYSCSIVTWKPSAAGVAMCKAINTGRKLWQGRKGIPKALKRRLGAVYTYPSNLLNTSRRQTAILQEQMRIQDIQYRDTIDLVTGRKVLRHNTEIELKTDHPVAYDSPDHTNPFGTIQDNTRNFAFYTKCHSLFGPEMSYLDIGCSGGGLVFEFALGGHVAIGLEGSDLSQRRGRANWRTIPDNLMTCDVTKPFLLHKHAQETPYKFDVISCWEVFEHIPETDLPQMLFNIKTHLKDGGIFVGSISKMPDDPLHVTIREDDWWKDVFAKHGLSMTIGYDDALEFNEFCRGIKGGLFDGHNYLTDPQKGLHFIARHG